MDYDLVIVGGGLSGSALATMMARAGAHVLVLERETRFRDRVRGETIHPWGVVELRALRLYEPLLERCAHAVESWTDYSGGQRASVRNLAATTPHHTGSLDFYHPEMQEVLIRLAACAGAEVWRGAAVRQVHPGERPTVAVYHDGSIHQVEARLVVGADGRDSRVRGWAGFQVRRDPKQRRISALLFEDMPLSEESVHRFNPEGGGRYTLIFPLGHRRCRAYLGFAQRVEHEWLSGKARIPAFIQACQSCGVPANCLAEARAIAPLATFEAASSWVDTAYRDGIVLLGDAAGTSDPNQGNGQSLALRDVRVLSSLLFGSRDWDAAARCYAHERDRYFGAMHTIESWFTEIACSVGPDADQVRAHFQTQRANGLIPDLIGVGPDQPTDEAARSRYLGI